MKYRLVNYAVIGCLCIMSLSISFGQTDFLNHRKYWYYKSRLNNDFLRVGLDSGESIPFTTRGTDNFSGFSDLNPKLSVGDATSNLGYYIALLATEYYLLSQSILGFQSQKSLSLSKVKHELFCALNAVNRLDYEAEALFQSGTENLNGFFIRDDISAAFLMKNYSHFNYFNSGNHTVDNDGKISNRSGDRGFASKFQNGIIEVEEIVNLDLEILRRTHL